jgi:polysaccharide export outer membrane protein
MLAGVAFCVPSRAQEVRRASSVDAAGSRSAAPAGGESNTVAFTTSMDVLDSARKLGTGDRVSLRIVEDRKPPLSLVVTDSGEMEVPLLGRVHAAGKTCKTLAYEMKKLLEKDYFYQCTVILGLDSVSTKSRGRVYMMGQVRTQGALELPFDEQLTLSKAILRSGGLADFASKKKVKIVRKINGKAETIFVDLGQILDKGHMENDLELQPDDLVVVPEKLINF